MKHYVFVTDINNERLKAIRRDFKLFFGVDIADKKYASYDSIEKKWDAIMGDIPLDCIGKDKGFYVQEFMQMLPKALFGEQSDIIRPSDMKAKIRNDAILKFKQYVAEMQALLDNYKIYEPDVWINAYLSIRYINARNDAPEGEDVGIAGYEDIGKAYYVKAKTISYRIPFESSQEGFCEKYVKKILGKDQVQILGASILEEKIYKESEGEEGFLGYKKQVRFDLGKDKRYTRWKQGKVYSLEKSKGFKTEDRAMFYKTINGALVRNLVNTMISTEHIYDVEDYLYLLEKLCMCKSLNWQNLIGCLYIAVAYYQRELAALDLWTDILVMFEAWIMNIPIINYRLELLVSGLIYIIHEKDQYFKNITEVEEKCKDALKEIEKNPIPFSARAEELIKNEWETQKKDLRVSEKVKVNHRQYYWIYAIMQRYIIDCQTPMICEKLREREIDWKEVISTISVFYTIFLKTRDSQPEGSEEIFNIGEICTALADKEEISKEDVLTEIKKKIKEANKMDKGERISGKILKHIFYVFIQIKAKNRYTAFKTKNV